MMTTFSSAFGDRYSYFTSGGVLYRLEIATNNVEQLDPATDTWSNATTIASDAGGQFQYAYDQTAQAWVRLDTMTGESETLSFGSASTALALDAVTGIPGNPLKTTTDGTYLYVVIAIAGQIRLMIVGPDGALLSQTTLGTTIITAISVSNNYLVAAQNDSATLLRVDISNKATPSVSTFTVTAPVANPGFSSMEIAANRLFIYERISGTLLAYDFSDPLNVPAAGISIQAGMTASAIEMRSNSSILVYYYNGGFYFRNLTTPFAQISTFNDNNANHFEVDDSYLYVVREGLQQVFKYSISNPSAPINIVATGASIATNVKGLANYKGVYYIWTATGNTVFSIDGETLLPTDVFSTLPTTVARYAHATQDRLFVVNQMSGTPHSIYILK